MIIYRVFCENSHSKRARISLFFTKSERIHSCIFALSITSIIRLRNYNPYPILNFSVKPIHTLLIYISNCFRISWSYLLQSNMVHVFLHWLLFHLCHLITCVQLNEKNPPTRKLLTCGYLLNRHFLCLPEPFT